MVVDPLIMSATRPAEYQNGVPSTNNGHVSLLLAVQYAVRLARAHSKRDTDNMSSRRNMRLLGLCAIILAGTAGAEPVGVSAVFLGWHPDSSDFAWRATKLSKTRERRTISYMKRITTGLIAERRPYRYSVPMRTEKKAYVIDEIAGERLSTFEQVFTVANDHRLRVRLNIHKKRLGYTMYIERISEPNSRRRAIGGVFDELWTEFKARVFRSPDSKWVAVMLLMATPYRSDVWVEGLRVSSQQ